MMKYTCLQCIYKSLYTTDIKHTICIYYCTIVCIHNICCNIQNRFWTLGVVCVFQDYFIQLAYFLHKDIYSTEFCIKLPFFKTVSRTHGQEHK